MSLLYFIFNVDNNNVFIVVHLVVMLGGDTLLYVEVLLWLYQVYQTNLSILLYLFYIFSLLIIK